jgi:general secretion pathway protein D
MIKHSAFRISRRLAGVAVVLMSVAAVSYAAPARYTINFVNADISRVAAAVQKATDTEFVVDPRVHAQVTISSSKPMSSAQFYEMFLIVLRENHFVAVPSGGVMKVIPETDIIS